MNRTECEEAVNDICKMCFESTNQSMDTSLLNVLLERSTTKIAQ